MGPLHLLAQAALHATADFIENPEARSATIAEQRLPVGDYDHGCSCCVQLRQATTAFVRHQIGVGDRLDVVVIDAK